MVRHDLAEKYTVKWFEQRRCHVERGEVFKKAILIAYSPNTVMDLGCGRGYIIKYLLMEGIEAWGIEGSPNCLNNLDCPANRVAIRDLRDPLPEAIHHDLCISIEVAEHIENEFVDTYIDNLCKMSPNLMLTIDSGHGFCHYTREPLEWWDKKFADRNYYPDTDKEELIRPILKEGFTARNIPPYTDNLRCYKMKEPE